MPEFAPVSTIADAHLLDPGEVQAGYLAGNQGAPEPLGSRFSRAFWHGWRNGAVDGGHRANDAAQAVLVHEFACLLSCTHRAAGLDADSAFFEVPVQ